MRTLPLAALLCLVGCDGDQVAFEHEGVRLGMSRTQVEALRPGLQPKASKGSDQLDEEAETREVLERIDPESDTPLEAYGFSDDRLTMMLLVHGPDASLDGVVEIAKAANGRPDGDTRAGGGRAVTWERGTTQLSLMQFPRAKPIRYETPDGEEATLEVGFLLMHGETGGPGGGALRWVWVGGVALLGLACLGSVLLLKQRLDEGRPEPRTPLKVTASATALLAGGLYCAGLLSEVLTITDGLAVLLPLAPALWLNTQLEKRENLQSTRLQPDPGGPVAFNG